MASMDLAGNLMQFPYEAAKILRKMNVGSTSEPSAKDIAKSFTTTEQKYITEPLETAMYSYIPAYVYPQTSNRDRMREEFSTNAVDQEIVTAKKMSTFKNTRTLEKRKRGHECAFSKKGTIYYFAERVEHGTGQQR
jgi:hypothetical protein